MITEEMIKQNIRATAAEWEEINNAYYATIEQHRLSRNAWLLAIILDYVRKEAQ